MMTKVFYTMMIAMLAAVTSLSGQGQGMGQGQGQMMVQTDSEKLTAYKIAFFTQRLELSPAEAEKFWPVYNDYSARRNKLQADRLSLIRYATRNEANMSNDELSSTAEKLARTFSDEATMVVAFNSDLKKVLPPAKVIRLYQIENQYKLQLLRELNQRRQGQPQGQGARDGAGQIREPDL